MRKLVALLTLVLLLLVSLPVMAQDDAGTAHVRVVNLSPRAEALTVSVGRTAVARNVALGTASLYVEVPAGDTTFTTSIADRFGPLEVSLADGDYVTLVAAGTRTFNAVKEEGGELAEGNARVTVFHGIEGAGPVDVLADGAVIVDAIDFPGSFFTPAGPLNDGAVSLDVPAGTYNIQVTPNGRPEAPIFDLPGTALSAGMDYFVAAYVNAGGPAVAAIASTKGNIVDAAASVEDFSTLVAAVQAADPKLLETLAGKGPFTVFAPTNDAFAAALAALDVSAADLLADTEMLTSVLRYHIVGASGGGDLLSGELVDGRGVQTLNGGFIEVSAGENGGVVLNGSVNVVAADILTSNGVIHVIDGVLLPPTE